MNGDGHRLLSVPLPDEVVDAIVERVLARLGDRRESPSNAYLDVTGAAELLACPVSRIYSLVSARRIPHHRDGSRLLFDRQELRLYVQAGGAKRP